MPRTRRFFYRKRPPRRASPWAPCFALALGAVLLAMAIPRLLSGLEVLRHEALFRDLAAGRPVGAERLAQAAGDHLAALAWHEEANLRADLATLDYALALQFGFGQDLGRLHLERSLEHNRMALAGNPAQPYAWVQVAIAEEALHGPSPRSLAALFASFERAPLQPRLAVLRAGLGLRSWTLLDESQRALIAAEALVAAEVNPRGLAQAVSGEAVWSLLQDLLIERPELLLTVRDARG